LYPVLKIVSITIIPPLVSKFTKCPVEQIVKYKLIKKKVNVSVSISVSISVNKSVSISVSISVNKSVSISLSISTSI
jgi:hypothetical protein